jgi:hypothetical protein
MKKLIAFVFACGVIASCTTTTNSAENQTADSTATVAAPAADTTVAAPVAADAVVADSLK